MLKQVRCTYRLALMVLALGHVAVGATNADDWPQILGPNRNGVSGEKIPDKFRSGGPTLAWSMPLGQGYAGPAVQSTTVVVFHRAENKERLQALDARSGKPLWKADFPALYRGGVNEDKGPRCVPLIAGKRVYVYGAAGDCHAVDLASGEKLWSRSLAHDYGAPDGYFGAGSTPILIGNVLLVNVGGKKAGIVGLDATTGEVKWTATSEQASYSSPAVLRRGADEKAIFITRLNCFEIAPETGDATKLFSFGQSGPTVNAAVPLVIGKRVFVTASYGVGGALYDLAGAAPAEIWANDDSLSSQYSTPVVQDGYLYGIHGREDIPPAHLRCVELATGNVKWSQDAFGVAHPIRAGNKLLLVKIDGELVLAEASPKAYRELDRANIASGVTRALPALANGHLYLRSSDKLLCVKVGESNGGE